MVFTTATATEGISKENESATAEKSTFSTKPSPIVSTEKVITLKYIPKIPEEYIDPSGSSSADFGESLSEYAEETDDSSEVTTDS